MIREVGGDLFQWLRGFFYVAQTGTVSLAATKMGRTQSTISHQLKCLEDYLGVMLFDRTKTQMVLTPEGKAVLDKAIVIFDTLSELETDITSIDKQLEGAISIVSTPAINLTYLPRFVVAFTKRHPNVRFDLEAGTFSMVIEKVQSAEADMGIIGRRIEDPKLVFMKLFDTRPILIGPRKNPFPLTQEPTLEEISQLPFIMFPPTATLYPLVVERFSADGLEINAVLSLNNFEMIKRYVALGMGVSILYEYMIEARDKNVLKVYPIDGYFIRRQHGLLLRKKKYVSPPLRAFIRTLKPEFLFP